MNPEGWGCVWAALLLLVLPLPWLLAAAAAAGIHEVCHMGAVRLLGGRVNGFRIGMSGAKLEASLQGFARQLLAILAGPAGSLSLLFLAPVFPRIALCGAVQGLYNLLPVQPLDGGRAVSLCLRRWCPKWEKAVGGVLTVCVTAAAVVLAAAVGSSLILIGAVILAGEFLSCKEGVFGVQ